MRAEEGSRLQNGGGSKQCGAVRCHANCRGQLDKWSKQVNGGKTERGRERERMEEWNTDRSVSLGTLGLSARCVKVH